VKVHIGVPCYGGLAPQFVQSLLTGALVCQSAGIALEVDWVQSSLIAKARNQIAARFLASDAEALFFVDADMEFSAVDLVKMLRHPAWVLGGDYVKKDGSGSRTAFPLDVFVDGVQEATHLGTGFLKITREAFALMDPPQADGIGCYFNCGPRDGRYVGEDYAFCEDYRAAGGRLWLYPATLGHIGPHVYRSAS
jgi:hypothetical protein